MEKPVSDSKTPPKTIPSTKESLWTPRQGSKKLPWPKNKCKDQTRRKTTNRHKAADKNKHKAKNPRKRNNQTGNIRNAARHDHNRRHTQRQRRKRRLDEAKKHIVNLSSKTLTEEEIIVLHKGLSYIPTTNVPNRSILLQDYGAYIRRLRLTYRFRNSTTEYKKNPFKKKSTYIPPHGNTALETYITNTERELRELLPTKPRMNLRKEEFVALKKLSTRTDIVIKKADKGSCIVIEDVGDYINNGEKHLQDEKTYTQLEEDPTGSIANHITEYLNETAEAEHISRQTVEAIKPSQETRTQVMYFLKKMHKTPPGIRPIVSGCDGPTESISRFADYILQPLAKKQDSYIRDSKQFVQIMEALKVPTQSLLVCIDVSSLYTNIPQQEGMEICRRRIEQEREDQHLANVIQRLLQYILEDNVFKFNGKMYRQIFGTAMGTKMAPSFANIFMSDLEERFLLTQSKTPLIWKRYIDDIFMIWTHSPEELQRFLQQLNDFHHSIKFTYDISETEATFLDVTVYKGKRHEETQILDCKTHFKPTNTFQYVHASSCHPAGVKKGIAIGECLRFLRNTSNREEFEEQRDNLLEHLQNRGYPPVETKERLMDITFDNRSEHLRDKERKEQRRPIFVTTYSPWWRNLRRTLTNHWDLIVSDPTLAKLFPEQPMIAYRRSRNIQEFVTRARLPEDEQVITQTEAQPYYPQISSSISKCNHPQCGTCKMLRRRREIRSTITKEIFPINDQMTCATERVIYLIECEKCNMQYVGQTNKALRQRMAKHREALRAGKPRRIYHHFNRNDHSEEDMKVTPMEKVPAETDILAREQEWITRLRTRKPDGLNFH